MDKKKSALSFPCDFSIKIIGIDSVNFKNEILLIVNNHFVNADIMPDFTFKKSNKNNYLAITAKIYVLNQVSLNAVYQELVKHPDVKMVL